MELNSNTLCIAQEHIEADLLRIESNNPNTRISLI